VGPQCLGPAHRGGRPTLLGTAARARRRQGATALAATVAWALTGCGGPDGPAAADHPGIVLVTLDTFRQDHLGCAGNPLVRTPHLDRLERRGVQWPEAVTAIPLTTPSHATILTGMTPRSHGLVKNRMRLDPGVTTLAQRLQAAGWRTGAVVSSRVVLSPEFGLDRGFDTYRVIEPPRLPASGEGAQTATAAVEWLDETGGPGSFLWVHFFDAHLPYLAPDPLNDLYDPGYGGSLPVASVGVQRLLQKGPDPDPRDVRHLALRYAAEITFVDTSVGRVIRAAQERDPATRILVTADHGEGLYEHQRYFGHDLLLYETAVRVPFLLAGGPPSLRERAPERLVPDPARTTDVTPTLLGLADLEIDAAIEGRDLPAEPPRTGDDLQFVTETHPVAEKAAPIYSLRTGREKVIWPSRARQHEAYDLVTDPGERHDLYGEHRPLFRTLYEDLVLDLRNRPLGQAATVDDERGGPDAATREALESLGYVDR